MQRSSTKIPLIAIQIQVKGSHTRIKWDVSQGCKGSSTYTYDHLNGCRKSFWQNSTPIYGKNARESGHRGDRSQHKKGHMQETHSKVHSQCWNVESTSPEIRKTLRVPTVAVINSHRFGSPSQSHQRRKRNKRNPGWKRSKCHVTVWRWHDR